MRTKLDELLENVTPERILERVSMPIDSAINAFRWPHGSLDDRGAFISCITRFWQQMFANLLGQEVSLNPDPLISSAHAVRLLEAAFGRDGISTAHLMAQRGIEGGRYAVLKAVALQMVLESERMFIRTMLDDLWSQLSFDEQEEAIREYFDRFGHLLPPELTRRSPAQFAGRFPEILVQHPSLMARLRRLV